MTHQKRNLRIQEALELCQKNLAPIIKYELTKTFGQLEFHGLAKYILHGWNLDYPIRGFFVTIGYQVEGRKLVDILEIAAALELAQIASVVLDDVIDESEVRAGPSAYKKFGASTCIMAADILKSSATTLFLRAVSAGPLKLHGLKALQVFEKTYQQVCLGQLIDINLEGKPLVPESRYMDMIKRTTAGFVAGAMEVGLTLGAVGKQTADILRKYSWSAGMALQIYDDVLDLMPHQFQLKPLAQDIRQRKQRLPLIQYLRNCSHFERARAAAILRKRRLNNRDVHQLRSAIIENGALKSALERGREFSRAASRYVTRLPENPYRKLLAEFLELLQPEADMAITTSARRTLLSCGTFS